MSFSTPAAVAGVLIRDTLTLQSVRVDEHREPRPGISHHPLVQGILFDGKNSKNLFYSPFWNTVKVSIGSCAIAIDRAAR